MKPEFFRHEELFDLEKETGLPIRLAFAGLWTACDREGRFKWRPRSLKAEILPFDDLDFSRVLDALSTREFVAKYVSGGVEYGFVPSWGRHQWINHREQASTIPPPPEQAQPSQTEQSDACSTRAPRVNDATPTGEAHDPDAARGEGVVGRSSSKGKKNLLHGAETVLQTVSRSTQMANDLVDEAKGIFLRIPLSDSTEYPIHIKTVQEWEREFPNVDVRQEIRSTRGFWLARQPHERKAKHEVRQSLRWYLSKKQDGDFSMEEL